MPAFKAVIDTSVMVSVAFAKQGLAKQLKDMIADEDFMLVASKKILKELYQVLHYPRIIKRFSLSEDDTNEYIGLIVEKALITEGLYRADGITEDPAMTPPRGDVCCHVATGMLESRRSRACIGGGGK